MPHTHTITKTPKNIYMFVASEMQSVSIIVHMQCAHEENREEIKRHPNTNINPEIYTKQSKLLISTANFFGQIGWRAFSPAPER